VLRVAGRGFFRAAPAGHEEQFAFLKFPDSPVEPLEGWAQLAGNEVRSPSIEVLNKSAKAVKYVELGWLVRDQKGQQYMAASLPAADPALYLPAGRTPASCRIPRCDSRAAGSR